MVVGGFKHQLELLAITSAASARIEEFKNSFLRGRVAWTLELNRCPYPPRDTCGLWPSIPPPIFPRTSVNNRVIFDKNTMDANT